ncbi:alpha/beta fold hydrolase [Erythrobacter mangrovi]|uniref:Alpha/beta hydrolase n=1 Tax=Erythrobacter mangrovi TaxID=2739433 RepID=A0A7D3XHJ9_9SPHN|nr:alpha/beta hydrolase [Erythrobacter mangrovi]QKG70519.1 alpha/beta hydrolase [Erythrobacter mangrovi]
MGSILQNLALRLDAGFNAKHIDRFRNGWPASSRSDISFFETDRVLFRYREIAGPSGAPTLVFTADPPVTLEHYDAMIELASKDFRLVIFELPGQGFSPGKSAYRFGFRETNDEVARFLRQVAGEGAIYAFSCVAGLAAVDIATRYPELVCALILIQAADPGGLDVWKKSRDPKGILRKPILGQYMMRKLAGDRMPKWFELALGRASDHERFCSCSRTSMGHGALWSLASAFQAYHNADIELAQPAQPCLAIWGELDGSHTPETRASTTNMAPGMEVRSLPAAGHFPELQDPAIVFRTIKDWLATQRIGENEKAS